VNRLVLAVCCVMLGGGIAVADESITQVDSKKMSDDANVLPASGYATAGQPDAAGLSNAAKAGYGVVVDMRAADEDRGFDEPQVVVALGMTYVAFPIADEKDISFEKAAELDALLASFDGPVLVHCKSGNRVGALFALRARNNGADSEEALAVGKAAGMTRLDKLVRERLGLAAKVSSQTDTARAH